MLLSSSILLLLMMMMNFGISILVKFQLYSDHIMASQIKGRDDDDGVDDDHDHEDDDDG